MAHPDLDVFPQEDLHFSQFKPFTDAAESVSDPLEIYRVLAEADKTPRWASPSPT
jgi:hypothetical protein